MQRPLLQPRDLSSCVACGALISGAQPAAAAAAASLARLLQLTALCVQAAADWLWAALTSGMAASARLSCLRDLEGHQALNPKPHTSKPGAGCVTAAQLGGSSERHAAQRSMLGTVLHA